MTIDVLMTAALLFLMGYQFWGETAHEWIGAGMFVLFLLHHILNGSWHKNLFRGKYPPIRIFLTAIDVLTLISMIAQMYSGIVLSRHVHILGAYWGFLLMSLHLGLHWNMVLGAVKRKFPVTSQRVRYLSVGIGLAVALYGTWVFVKRDFAVYMFLQSEFVFMDYEEAKVLFYLDYLSLMGTCIFISHYVGKLFRSLKKYRKI